MLRRGGDFSLSQAPASPVVKKGLFLSSPK
jgi:hypothetical protein